MDIHKDSKKGQYFGIILRDYFLAPFGGGFRGGLQELDCWETFAGVASCSWARWHSTPSRSSQKNEDEHPRHHPPSSSESNSFNGAELIFHFFNLQCNHGRCLLPLFLYFDRNLLFFFFRKIVSNKCLPLYLTKKRKEQNIKNAKRDLVPPHASRPSHHHGVHRGWGGCQQSHCHWNNG